ncbi:porin family protein [Dysgonomonas reticulitermitis]
MKKLKNVLVLSILFCLCSSVAFSQTNEGLAKKTQFIIKGGLNFSTIAVSDKDNDYYGTEKSKVGFNLGIAADIPLGKKFYFQPNLNFSAKGSKQKEINIGTEIENLSLNTLYMQIPLLFAYKFDFKKWNNSFNIAFGPYVAYGVGGNIVSGSYVSPGAGGMIYRPSIKVGSFSSDICNKADIGMNMEFQFELPKIMFILGYEYGFTNMIKTHDLFFDDLSYEYRNRTSYHNSTNYIGIGYKF